MGGEREAEREGERGRRHLKRLTKARRSGKVRNRRPAAEKTFDVVYLLVRRLLAVFDHRNPVTITVCDCCKAHPVTQVYTFQKPSV